MMPLHSEAKVPCHISPDVSAEVQIVPHLPLLSIYQECPGPDCVSPDTTTQSQAEEFQSDYLSS